MFDLQNRFSNAQAVTAAADSTDMIDLGAARDIGTGKSLFIVVFVDVSMTDSSSNSTITVALQGDSTSTMTPDSSVNLFTIPATTAAGTKFIYRLDPSMAPLQYQYINLKYTPANGDLTTGSFTAYLSENVEVLKAYPDAITIA